MLKNCFIRTDASHQIGSGHVMRCLALADGLRNYGFEIKFICRLLPGNLNNLIRSKGFVVYDLQAPKNNSQDFFANSDLSDKSACSTGVSQAQDAEETISALKDKIPDWLIVDQYCLDSDWETIIHSKASKIMVIDDLANRMHNCNILVDQNYESIERYQNRVNQNCRLLIGPKFALLRPEYATYRKGIIPRIGKMNRILVFFGGADFHNMTGLTLEALSHNFFRKVDVDIVLGDSYAHREKLNYQAVERSKTEIHSTRPHLADLMAHADLAIGAGGVTNWERMCLGLPSIVISIAENQVPISKILDKDGAIRYLGKAEEMSVKIIQNSLVDEIQMKHYIRRSEIALTKCDGLGITRVIDTMVNSYI